MEGRLNVLIQYRATAVSVGAVIRAFNKDEGPLRKARSSYGILRTEGHMDYPEHAGVKPSFDRHDGQPYVVNTVDWVLKLVRGRLHGLTADVDALTCRGAGRRSPLRLEMFRISLQSYIRLRAS